MIINCRYCMYMYYCSVYSKPTTPQQSYDRCASSHSTSPCPPNSICPSSLSPQPRPCVSQHQPRPTHLLRGLYDSLTAGWHLVFTSHIPVHMRGVCKIVSSAARQLSDLARVVSRTSSSRSAQAIGLICWSEGLAESSHGLQLIMLIASVFAFETCRVTRWRND